MLDFTLQYIIFLPEFFSRSKICLEIAGMSCFYLIEATVAYETFYDKKFIARNIWRKILHAS